MSDISLAFEELFFGAGSWLGLLLMLVLVLIISIKVRYGGVITIPVCIFLGMEYLDESMMWNAIIMFVSAIFILVNLVKDK